LLLNEKLVLLLNEKLVLLLNEKRKNERLRKVRKKMIKRRKRTRRNNILIFNFLSRWQEFVILQENEPKAEIRDLTL
jgi:hypothetical protein